MERGWVKLWRRLEDSAIFQSEGLLKCFIWALMKATHKEIVIPVRTGRGFTEVVLKPGQFIFGRKSAAKALKMPESTVRNRFKKIESLEMLTQSQLAGFTQNQDGKMDTHFTIYFVVNWQTYQGEDEKEDRQKDRQRTGKGHKQECKEEVVYSGAFFSVTEGAHRKYESAYPGLDLLCEYRKAEAWLQSNPTKRKTERGYPRFINGWLSRAYEKQKPQGRDWKADYPPL